MEQSRKKKGYPHASKEGRILTDIAKTAGCHRVWHPIIVKNQTSENKRKNYQKN